MDELPDVVITFSWSNQPTWLLQDIWPNCRSGSCFEN